MDWEQKGDFTVKSAYHIAYDLTEATEEGECSSSDPNAKLWKKLWCLHLPAKVKIFGWRACINGLPKMENLFLRGISTNNTCLVCKKDLECIQHALLGCEFAKMVWNHWQDTPLTFHHSRLSFLDSALYLIINKTVEDLELFFASTWAIWYNRNQIIHNKAGFSSKQVWQTAQSTMEDFTEAATTDLSFRRLVPSKWEPPSPGFYKINVDGATAEHDRYSSVCVVIRDSKGQLVAALSSQLQALYPAKLVEVLAMEQGVLLAPELQLSQVIFEANALSIIQATNNNLSRNAFGHIIQELQQARHSFAKCYFKHVCRDFNKVAHELAQFARHRKSTHLWKGVTPPFVLPLVQADLL